MSSIIDLRLDMKMIIGYNVFSYKYKEQIMRQKFTVKLYGVGGVFLTDKIVECEPNDLVAEATKVTENYDAYTFSITHTITQTYVVKDEKQEVLKMLENFKKISKINWELVENWQAENSMLDGLWAKHLGYFPSFDEYAADLDGFIDDMEFFLS